MKTLILGLLGVGLTGSLANAKLRSISVTSEQEWSSPRWMYDNKAKIKGPAVVQQLIELRKLQLDKRHGDCAQLARRLAAQASGIKNWLAVTELSCALARTKPEGTKELQPLKAVLSYIDQNPTWLLFGPQVEALRPSYAEAELVLFERQVQSERRAAWKTYDHIQQLKRWLGDDQRARLFRAAGELAFLEQDLSLAMEMMARSLGQRESSDVRRRLEAIRTTLTAKKSESAPEPPNAEGVIGATASDEERGLVDRMQRAIQSGDLLSAVEDGVKLIGGFPGGTAAKSASDRILEIYLSLGAKTEANYASLREKCVDAMLGADAARVARWANNAYVKGFYKDASRLGEAAVRKYDGHPDATKMLLVSANAAAFVGDSSEAERRYEQLAKQHHGSEEERNALFRWGLLRFRAEKWADAAAHFERLLAVAPGTDWEYLALHWHWRALQRLKAKEAPLVAERLMTKYPLTYYGLRARAEANAGKLNFANTTGAALKSEIWLSETQGQGWERFQLLLKAGWFDEAQAELAQLPEPISTEDKLVRARLLAVAFDHLQAIRLFNEAWTERPELFSWNVARAAFPNEYPSAIEKEAKVAQVDQDLIRGLIRQESSFRAKAISAANAYGVMQLLPATAQEVAQSQKWKANLVLPDDLFNPEINIRLGSIYISRLIRAYKGHVPLALGAYNAGVGRMRKWLSARPQLKGLEERRNSNPEDEIWIDELPWEETSSYVKAVLRNLLIYQLYAKGSLNLGNPVWDANRP